MRDEYGPTNEARFLAEVGNESYRKVLKTLLDESLPGLHWQWGTTGASFRVETPDRAEPLSIAWLFPADRGWYGLRGFNMGFDPWSSAQTPSMASLLEEYVAQVSRLSGIQHAKTKYLNVFHLNPATTIRCHDQVAMILREFADRVKAIM